MGWFEEQLEERRAADSKALEDSFHKIAGVVLGQREAEKLGDERIITKNAIDEILKFYHLKPVEVPDVSQLEALLNQPFEEMYQTWNDEEKRFFWTHPESDV